MNMNGPCRNEHDVKTVSILFNILLPIHGLVLANMTILDGCMDGQLNGQMAKGNLLCKERKKDKAYCRRGRSPL